MNNPHRCEDMHCRPLKCQFGVISKCVPVNHINDEVKQGAREFCIELGDMTVRAENHVEAVEKVARWLIANASNEEWLVGDTSELNDPIHPFMSRSTVKLTDGKGKVVM